MTAVSMQPLHGPGFFAQREGVQRPLAALPQLAALPGGKMSALDRVVPQATQLAVLNRLVALIVLGECDLISLQKKIGFKSLRNVYYYLEAARWARLLDETQVRPTSRGRRYVQSRFDARVLVEGLRGRALFEEVMRVTAGDAPTPNVVAGVLRRWSFRYSKGTLARRAQDFCRLFGSIIEQATHPAELAFVVHTAWVEPEDLLAVDGVAMMWPVQQLVPLPGFRRIKDKKPAMAKGWQFNPSLEDGA